MRRLRIVKRIKPKKNTYKVVSANDFLASDPLDEKRAGIPSHFQETLDQMEQLYDGLQLHCRSYGLRVVAGEKQLGF